MRAFRRRIRREVRSTVASVTDSYQSPIARLIDKIGAKAGNTGRDIRRGAQTLQSVQITGVEPVVGQIEKVEIEAGRYLSDAENESALRVAFVGADVATKLFPSGDALGNEISISGIPYKIIGIQVAKGSVFGQPQDAFIQLPIKTFGANFGGLRRQRAPLFRRPSGLSDFRHARWHELPRSAWTRAGRSA